MTPSPLFHRWLNSWYIRVLTIALVGIVALLCVYECLNEEIDAKWELISDGVREESAHNDGDSVAVRFNGRSEVFRLYFVDTLETNPASTQRLARQAATFGIPPSRLDFARELAQRAKHFTRQQTSNAFRVYTRWEKVSPGSNNPSVRAFIETQGGDLATLLVRNGLAVIKSGSAVSAHPDGRSAASILTQLRAAESEAKKDGRGGWARAPNNPMPPHNCLDANDRDALISAIGSKTQVEGRVSRIGSLPNERILFLNFAGNDHSHFCAVVRRPSLDRLRSVLGKNFPHNLENRTIRISGAVTEYKGNPQIEVTDPTQIILMPDGGQ